MTLTTQFITILCMVGGGIFVAASLDVFERLFGNRNKKSWTELFYQLSFWLSQAAILFYILYKANYGELRVYVFLAILCGFAMYRALLQPLFLTGLEKLIRVAMGLYRVIKKVIYRLLIWPIRSIIFLIFSLLIVVYKIVLKGILLIIVVLFYPIRIVFIGIWRLLPKNAKKYLMFSAGFWDKIKNIMISWKKRFYK